MFDTPKPGFPGMPNTQILTMQLTIETSPELDDLISQITPDQLTPVDTRMLFDLKTAKLPTGLKVTIEPSKTLFRLVIAACLKREGK